MPARAAATAAGVGSASMKKLSCLFVLISQFLDERHNIIFRGQAGAFCFSSHFLLKHLHGIHSRIDNADGVSLDDKSDPITVLHTKHITDILRDCDLPFCHDFGIVHKRIC